MKPRIWSVVLWLGVAVVGWGQVHEDARLNTWDGTIETSPTAYTVQGAKTRQEELLRTQIQTMHPDVLPRRIIFVPHWKYLYAARMYRLHVPTGMTSRMFTHLASRSVFIDTDRYGDDDSLGHWMAHELGHLVMNSSSEEDAEKAAAKYRRRLKERTQTRPTVRQLQPAAQGGVVKSLEN